jgi:hypothetical protein
MSGIFVVLIIVGLIIVYVFCEVMVKIGVAGVNPAKLVADILNKKKTDDIELSNKLREDVTVKRWRLTAGILFGLVMFFILAYFSSSLIGFYPWVHYVFVLLLLATIIVFIVLAIKEQKFKKKMSL